MTFVFDPPYQTRIPILGQSAYFPVRRIWCVGRNYADHAREMGGDPDREPPFFFAKPSDAIVPGGGKLSFPSATQNFHHEVELAVAIGLQAKDISAEAALDIVYGYAVALDMTRRDLQDVAKRTGRPWELAKGFDQSCPISAIRPAGEVGDLRNAQLRLEVNGQSRQSAMIGAMTWSIAECIAALSQFVELYPGDILLTGTPSGVGSVKPGDHLHASCQRVGDLVVSYQNA